MSSHQKDIKIIDSHQHFWHYNAEKHDWIDDEMASIRKDFLPSHLEPILLEHNIDGCVAVQADQTELETNFLIKLANENRFIKGIVGWVNLLGTDIEERLVHYAQFSTIKGFRHVLQGEEPEFMLQPNFINGIKVLEQFGFTYDMLIFPKHLESAIKLVQLFPTQLFVIDHLAKPYIMAGLIDEWKQDIKAISHYENVYCKMSGMVTEADYHLWKYEDFIPYMDVATSAFGTKRLMYGSDWPVCHVAGGYNKMMSIVKNYFSSFSASEQQDFFGNNATRFYRL